MSIVTAGRNLVAVRGVEPGSAPTHRQGAALDAFRSQTDGTRIVRLEDDLLVPSCGTESPGPFCTHCGERRIGADDHSLRHYADIDRLPYIAAHAVVATHLWSFILVLLAAVVPALAFGFVAFSGSPSIAAALATHDNPVSVFIQCVVGACLFVMLRRVYSTSVWHAGAIAVAIAWSFFHIVWLYRFLLFVITLHSL